MTKHVANRVGYAVSSFLMDGGSFDLYSHYYFSKLTYLPSAYINLINSFSTKYYVSKNGNDTTGTGSEGNPFLTINKAITTAANGNAIIVNPGTYIETNNGPSTSEEMVYTTKSISIIGYPGQVIWQEASDLAARDNHIFGTSSTGFNVYGLIFERNNNGRTNNYSTSIWGYNAAATQGNVYNCVLRETNANGIMSHVYDNAGTGGGKLYNCTIVASNWLSPYTCGSTNVTSNTALTSANTFNLCGTSTNNINNATLIDTLTYRLTANNTTYGVYSGTYAWQ